ncbi:MAG: hypothetical protein R3A10_13545 [Caldilineaceae bacterium]
MSTISHAYPARTTSTSSAWTTGCVSTCGRIRPPVAVMEGHLATEAVHDPAELPGLAHFVSGMVYTRSAGFDYDTFNETVEGVARPWTCRATPTSPSFP